MDSFNSIEEWQRIVLIAYASVVAILVVSRNWLARREIRLLPRLTPQSPQLPREQRPFVSILVPAKDEEEVIEKCVRSLMAQDYENFEILVVDDRSTDATPEIVERLSGEDSRVSLVRILDLPPGWTGKTHALQCAQKFAKGSWLLFVDADTLHDPTCVSVTMKDCLTHEAELLSMLPGIDVRSFWERVVQAYAGTTLLSLFPPSRVNNPDCPNMGFANGQFILISRRAYDAIGQHESVREKFVEDINIGRRIRKARISLRLVSGTEVFTVRMYSSLGQIIRGWSRIFYGAFDGHSAAARMMQGLLLVMGILPQTLTVSSLAAVLMGIHVPFALGLFSIGVFYELGQCLVFGQSYRLTKTPLRYLALRPLSIAMTFYIMNKTAELCRTRKVVWRGTSYDAQIESKSAHRPAVLISASENVPTNQKAALVSLQQSEPCNPLESEVIVAPVP